MAVLTDEIVISAAQLDELRAPTTAYLDGIERESVTVPDGGGVIRRAVDELAADILLTHNAEMEKLPARLKAAFTALRKIQMDVAPTGFTKNDREQLLALEENIQASIAFGKKKASKDNRLGKAVERLEGTARTLDKTGLGKTIASVLGGKKAKK